MAGLRLITALAAGALLAAHPAWAAKIVINQAMAEAGGVTSGDDPGFPVRISASGSYILDSDLTVPANTSGIEIVASGVTIDLNGFRIQGTPTGATQAYGISAGGALIRIRNGNIAGFRTDGIAVTGDYLTVEGVSVTGNKRDGVHAPTSRYVRILGSNVTANTEIGITCGLSCHIEESVVTDNKEGVQIVSGSVIKSAIHSNSVRAIRNQAGIDVGIGRNSLVDNGTVSGDQAQAVEMQWPNFCDRLCVEDTP